ncbi:OmpH family outer membrane protein, partial [Elusimicrobiota bacterium]
GKELELSRKTDAFRVYRSGVEKNLVDIESQRSEILLGKIYRAVREVAREQGVSVVIDKTQILFGRDSVDLTDQVIRRLEEWSL